MPHPIRLRGPWQLVASEGETKTQLPLSRAEISQRVGEAGFCLQRAFHLPTGIDATTRIELVVGHLGDAATIVLNGHRLGDTAEPRGDWRTMINEQLQPRNLLSIEFQPATSNSPTESELLNDVRLEIHDD